MSLFKLCKLSEIYSSLRLLLPLLLTGAVAVGCGSAPGFEGGFREGAGDIITPVEKTKEPESSDASAHAIRNPDLFLLSKSSVIYADRNERFSVDYQLLTKEGHVRNMNLGPVAFELNPGVETEHLKVSWQVYSLESHEILIEKDFHLAKTEDGSLTFKSGGVDFEADTDKLIFSVIIENLKVSEDFFGEHGLEASTFIKIEGNEELPSVRKSVYLKKFVDSSTS